MRKILDELIKTLAKDKRFAENGTIKKSTVTDHALRLDKDLLKLLLSNKSLKDTFFQYIDGTLVFDKKEFQRYVSNKAFLPDSYTTFKNKIGLTSGEEYLSDNKEVVLGWPYKDCVLEGGQTKEEQRRNEIFWNQILAPEEIDRLLSPKALCNFKRYTAKGAHNAETLAPKDNFILKGNNLLALCSLKKRYKGKIKLIYIDPPYNTGNDSFRYNDSFNHSTWLTFMKNRLEAAKELLAYDGCLLIQIDNNEAGYLTVLCDEIFGRNNYRNSIITKKGTKSLQKQFPEIQKLNAGFDTILLYTRNEGVKLPNLFKELKGATEASWNNHWRGTDRPTMRYELFGIEPETGQWRWEKNRTDQAVENYKKLCQYIRIFKGDKTETTNDLVNTYFKRYLEENDITDHSDFELVRLSSNGKPEHYIPPRMQVLLSENWMDLSVAGRVTKFEHEKNEEILRRIIEWLTKKGDTVLDFFLGSGTTAAVAHKLGRQYIGIEQMEYGKEDPVERLLSVIKGDNKGVSSSVGWKGGGDFVYAELVKLNQELIEKISTASKKELPTLYNNIVNNPYIIYNVVPSNLEEHQGNFMKLLTDEKRKALIEILDQNQLYLNYSEIQDDEHNVSDSDKKLNTDFYNFK